MLTIKDVREALGLKQDRPVLAWIHSGMLSAIDVSTKGDKPLWRIEESEFERFKESRRAVPEIEVPRRRQRARVKSKFKVF